jgi:hypothetical protein
LTFKVLLQYKRRPLTHPNLTNGAEPASGQFDAKPNLHVAWKNAKHFASKKELYADLGL